LAALVMCLAVPISIAAEGMEGFAARHEAMKSWLTLATLVYFISGTVFYQLWRRDKEPNRA
jgi:hypothetical protein